jgi:hypothetical protein
MGGGGTFSGNVSGLLYLDADDYVELLIYNGDADGNALSVGSESLDFLEVIGPF